MDERRLNGGLPSHLLTGVAGERLALAWLSLGGYRLRHRNWRGGGGELDLVMQQRGEIVFVEVKTRGLGAMIRPEQAVDRAKQRTLVRAAAAYLGRFGLWERPCRFDVVAVQRRRRPPWIALRHFKDVIQVRGRQC